MSSAEVTPVTRLVRRALPVVVLPLGLVATGLASAPWLRAYPASVLAAPLFGAAVLSVLLPFLVVNVGVRRIWQTALIDLVGYLFFVTLVALRSPFSLTELWTGLVHGPSQVLTFALPLVSPRTLLVPPVTLCWLCGAVVGECIGRNWRSLLPYVSLLVTFGLAYAGTERAVTTVTGGRHDEALLAGGLLLAMLLLRAVQAWVDAATGDAPGEVSGLNESALPLRSVALGTLIALLVTAGAGAIVQLTAFPARSTTLARTPPLLRTEPLTPLAFVAGMRSANPRVATPLFSVTVDRPASRYIALGDVDAYNGDSWSFSRTFRPSGGVVPADVDPSLHPDRPAVAQQYTVMGKALAGTPWMPYIDRPTRVLGTGVDVDPGSGMIVPTTALHVGQRYSVVSAQPALTFGQLRRTALLGTASEAIDLQLPASVATSLGPVVQAFVTETGVPSQPAVPFLQAVMADLRDNYGLSGASPRPGTPGSSSPPSSPSPSPSQSASASPSGRASASGGTTTRTGGTSFAAVLASILGSSRSATPEQYATFVALIARQLDVPARIVTGFRLPGKGRLAPNTYTVTTRDAWSWVEVPVQGQGWVVLDPTPDAGSASPPPTSTGPSPRPSTASSAPPNALITQPTSGHSGVATGPTGTVGHPRSVPVARIVLSVAFGVTLIALLIVLGLLGRKALRVRRRRHGGDPRRRIVGAWQESLDVLAEAGLSELGSLTSSEVAEATEAMFGPESAERARRLGRSANVAIFSPTSWLDASQADAAWQDHVALRRAVRSRLPLTRRLRARLRYERATRSSALVGPASWAQTARSRNEQVRARSRHSARRRH